MKKSVSGIFVLLCLSYSFAQKSDKCQKVDSDETTCWGWVMGNIPVEGGKVKKIAGRVVTPNEEPVEGSLIEVFENSDQEIEKRKRVAACRTGSNGEFSFKGLRPGKYELRGSNCNIPGFSAGSTIITLAPKDKNASDEKTLVKLNISY